MNPRIQAQCIFVALLALGLAGCADHVQKTTAPSLGSSTPLNPRPSLAGSFETAPLPDDTRFVSATTKVEGDRFHIAIVAGHRDGHGAAPDGEGEGTVGDDGVATFDYEDSFFCRGRGSFRWTGRGYRLSIEISESGDAPPRFRYGTFTLHRR